jgi:hypoxanthine phosphoribosyltransferase
VEKKPYERILISSEQVQQTVRRMAGQINTYYAGADGVVALVILEGAKYFARDLLAGVDFPIQAEYLGASSYKGGTRSTGTVELKESRMLRQKIAGKRILLIDDIYDSGLTLAAVQDWVRACGPADVKTCVLLEKQIPHRKQIAVDFLGLRIEDAFVIGYGLDYQGRYRELPFVAVLSV